MGDKDPAVLIYLPIISQILPKMHEKSTQMRSKADKFLCVYKIL